jgi:type IV secretion system protein VirB5
VHVDSESKAQHAGVESSIVSRSVPTNESDASYVRGRSEFDSVFGDLAKGKRNWQLVAFAALGIGFVLAGGLISLTTQSRITPYVVEIDQLGRAQAIGPADQMRTIDQRVIVSQLARFVRDIRTVLGDPAGQADLIKRAYAYVDQKTTPFLNAYFTSPDNDPRILGKDITRLVEITSILAVPSSVSDGSQTWKVSWTESLLPRAGGGAAAESAWEGYFTTRITPPTTLDRITVNPLGLYITSITWTELAKRPPTAGQADRSDRVTPPTDASGVIR